MLSSLLVLASVLGADTISGAVSGAYGAPIDLCYVAVFSPDWKTSIGSGYTGPGGTFAFQAAPQEARLLVQPNRSPGAAGLGVFAWQPRVFALGPAHSAVALSVPPAVTYVIAAYGKDGELMRWRDWEAMGKYGPRFLYTTDSALRAVPAQVYPLYGELTGGEGGGRGAGIPAVIADPGQELEIHALFWATRGYGTLQLSAGAPVLSAAGQSRVINWNHALARDVIDRAKVNHFTSGDAGAWFTPLRAELESLEAQLAPPAEGLATPAEAAVADEILVKALEIADRAAITRAKRRALFVRYGTGALPQDKDVTPKRYAFSFGAYQGSPFRPDNKNPYTAEPAYSAARDAGFNLATILPAWGWAGPHVHDAAGLEHVFGAGALRAMGYAVKAHGVSWMQDFMNILPAEVRSLPHDQLIRAALNYQLTLLGALGEQVDVWEALNEPATTNVVNLTRDEMIGLLAEAAKNIAEKGKQALVNSPHEFNYGAKFELYTVEGKPSDPYPDTFVSFLDAAAQAQALDNVDIIGLQVYPGFRLREGKPGDPFEGPAWTPAFFERMLDTYARFRKIIHVTEFSVPSAYGADWQAGYWRAPWDEPIQAEYAEAVFTIAYGHPSVQSIGWWDITDEKPSIATGGLMRDPAAPKAVFDRLASFIEAAYRPQPYAPGQGGGIPGGAYSDPAAPAEELVQLPGWWQAAPAP